MFPVVVLNQLQEHLLQSFDIQLIDRQIDGQWDL